MEGRNEGGKRNLHPVMTLGADRICSLPHQFDVPFVIWCLFVINLSITSQIPRIHNLDGIVRESFEETCCNQLMLTTAKLAITYSLSSLLRFTPCPIGVRCSLSASTHNACNVVRGHNVSLCHSVKHYKPVNLTAIFL